MYGTYYCDTCIVVVDEISDNYVKSICVHYPKASTSKLTSTRQALKSEHNVRIIIIRHINPPKAAGSHGQFGYCTCYIEVNVQAGAVLVLMPSACFTLL